MFSKLSSHSGWLLLKWSAIGIGFNGAETNCRIAHVFRHPTDDQLLICLLFQRHHSGRYSFNFVRILFKPFKFVALVYWIKVGYKTDVSSVRPSSELIKQGFVLKNVFTIKFKGFNYISNEVRASETDRRIVAIVSRNSK